MSKEKTTKTIEKENKDKLNESIKEGLEVGSIVSDIKDNAGNIFQRFNSGTIEGDVSINIGQDIDKLTELLIKLQKDKDALYERLLEEQHSHNEEINEIKNNQEKDINDLMVKFNKMKEELGVVSGIPVEEEAVEGH